MNLVLFLLFLAQTISVGGKTWNFYQDTSDVFIYDGKPIKLSFPPKVIRIIYWEPAEMTPTGAVYEWVDFDKQILRVTQGPPCMGCKIIVNYYRQ